MKSVFTTMKSVFTTMKSIFTTMKSVFTTMKSVLKTVKSVFTTMKYVFLPNTVKIQEIVKDLIFPIFDFRFTSSARFYFTDYPCSSTITLTVSNSIFYLTFCPLFMSHFWARFTAQWLWLLSDTSQFVILLCDTGENLKVAQCLKITQKKSHLTAG